MRHGSASATCAARCSSTASSTPRPRAASSSRLRAPPTCPSIVTMCCSSGRFSWTLRILSTCPLFSHTITLDPEFPTTHSHSSAEFVGYTGTTIAPAVLIARLTIVNSTRVFDRMATRSPTLTPRSTRPRASSLTCRHISPNVIDRHSPSRRNIAAVPSPKRDPAERARSAIVLSCWPRSTPATYSYSSGRPDEGRRRPARAARRGWP